MLATNLLIDQGCRKLAHISGPLELSTSPNKRYQAFIDVASGKNIDYVIRQTNLDVHESYEKLAYKLFEEHLQIY
ncbi:hypothetical protein LF65_06900 [Clostridium beijerinckii]|uniref:Uncharacterized protein n=1 Tax=Clostridium beijerinckii TaxID=1520 RepID=A0A140DMK4_CLOBE|nr:hypothetical protein [Clostridium beijerinckii]AMK50499.1 hypothetical protein LF65_06900 [Clostridium beijerinckii]